MSTGLGSGNARTGMGTGVPVSGMGVLDNVQRYGQRSLCSVSIRPIVPIVFFNSAVLPCVARTTTDTLLKERNELLVYCTCPHVPGPDGHTKSTQTATS